MICFSGTAVVVEDVQMDLSGTYHPVDHGVCLEVHTTVFVAAGLPVQRKMIIELPVDEMNLLREYDDEITMSTIISSDENKLALFCHSFLVNAFSDVVCRRVEGLSEDFHKVYLVSRKETHPKVVDDYISFMSAYSFPNILETGTIN